MNECCIVAFVPRPPCAPAGNHCLWLRPGLEAHEGAFPDSFCKLWALQAACDELGVETVAAEVAPGLLVAPLLSWYNAAFDRADPRCGARTAGGPASRCVLPGRATVRHDLGGGPRVSRTMPFAIGPGLFSAWGSSNDGTALVRSWCRWGSGRFLQGRRVAVRAAAGRLAAERCPLA
jgi:hypothetical protein